MTSTCIQSSTQVTSKEGRLKTSSLEAAIVVEALGVSGLKVHRLGLAFLSFRLDFNLQVMPDIMPFFNLNTHQKKSNIIITGIPKHYKIVRG